jgi:hypothetical protein
MTTRYTSRDQNDNLTRQDERERRRYRSLSPRRPAEPSFPLDPAFAGIRRDPLIDAEIHLRLYRQQLPKAFLLKFEPLAIKSAALKHTLLKHEKSLAALTDMAMENSTLPPHMQLQQKALDKIANLERRKTAFDGYIADEQDVIKARKTTTTASLESLPHELEALVTLFKAGNPFMEQSTLNWTQIFNLFSQSSFNAMSIKQHDDLLKKEQKKEKFLAAKEVAAAPIAVTDKAWKALNDKIAKLEKQLKAKPKQKAKNAKGGRKNPPPPKAAKGQPPKRKGNGRK